MDNVIIAEKTIADCELQKTFDSSSVKVSNSKYFAEESREEGYAKENRPTKVVVTTDRSDYENVFVTNC